MRPAARCGRGRLVVLVGPNFTITQDVLVEIEANVILDPGNRGYGPAQRVDPLTSAVRADAQPLATRALKDVPGRAVRPGIDAAPGAGQPGPLDYGRRNPALVSRVWCFVDRTRAGRAVEPI